MQRSYPQHTTMICMSQHHTTCITLPPSHYRHDPTSITLPVSHYLHHTTCITLPVSHYPHHTTCITLPASHYQHHTTSITLPTSHYQHHTTGITLPASHYRHHTTGITLHASHQSWILVPGNLRLRFILFNALPCPSPIMGSGILLLSCRLRFNPIQRASLSFTDNGNKSLTGCESFSFPLNRFSFSAPILCAALKASRCALLHLHIRAPK